MTHEIAQHGRYIQIYTYVYMYTHEYVYMYTYVTKINDKHMFRSFKMLERFFKQTLIIRIT